MQQRAVQSLLCYAESVHTEMKWHQLCLNCWTNQQSNQNNSYLKKSDFIEPSKKLCYYYLLFLKNNYFLLGQFT